MKKKAQVFDHNDEETTSYNNQNDNETNPTITNSSMGGRD